MQSEADQSHKSTQSSLHTALPPLATGIEGLDDILGGGWPTRRVYLVEGAPGAGKTTLALQYLLQGRDRGEPVM